MFMGLLATDLNYTFSTLIGYALRSRLTGWAWV